MDERDRITVKNTEMNNKPGGRRYIGVQVKSTKPGEEFTMLKPDRKDKNKDKDKQKKD